MQQKLVCLPIWIAVLCFAGVDGRASAQSRSPLVEIRVESILASDPAVNSQPAQMAASHMDRRLIDNGVAPRLRSIFDFSNYRLIKNQLESTHCGDPVAFNLPGGHILHVEPFDAEGADLAISVMMFEGPRLVMHMPFRTERGGVLFLVDQHVQNQLYITAISVDSTPLLRHRHRPAKEAVPDAQTEAFPVLVPAQ